jgi:hypothetical protein
LNGLAEKFYNRRIVDARRGAADRGKYRRAAGAITAMNETGSDSSADRRGKQHRHPLGLALVPGGD